MFYVYTDDSDQIAFSDLADALNYIVELLNTSREVTITIYHDPKEVT